MLIILLDRDGLIVNWNRGAEKIKGYKEEEIVGKSFQEFYLDDDRQNGAATCTPARGPDEWKGHPRRAWRKRKDGTTFWGSIRLTALHDDTS